ncbi:MAG: helix-turn-helix transcriptional regulator [Acidobacteria bacterium]|nr:helix-turn-helix transcriptional regulator [Acidobacteriota bacterium]
MRAAGVVYEEHRPDPALTGWIASYWSLAVFRGSRPWLTVPPEGCAHLAFRGGRGVLLGPRVEPLRSPAVAGSPWFGVRFRPGAARAFLGLSSALPLRNALQPVETVEGLEWAGELAGELAGVDGEVRVSITDRRLLSLAASAKEPDAALANAIGLILASARPPGVGCLATAAGLSARQFRRRFTAAVGLSPKELLRVWRFRRCALDAFDRRSEWGARGGPGWAAHAFRHGYSDQSHLIREFRRLVGLGPAELARRISAIELTASAWASPPPSGDALQRRARRSPATGRPV